MKSQEYWRKREQDNIKRLLKNDINYQKEIERIYAENLRNIEVQIDSLYRRYSDKNGEISLADVKAIADKTDVTALAETARKMSQDKDFSQYANDVLAKYNLKMQVSRLELLKDEINLELIENGVNVDKYVTNKLTDETKAELKRQAGILGESLDVTDTKLVTNIINGSFGSSTFSERLWGNTQYLANSLDTLLTQSIINGRHPNDVARDLRKQFDVNQKQAERLMRTESARVHAECAVKSMEKNGVTQYEWVSEPSACKICSPLNGKTFEVKGAEFGNANHPLFPLHPNCRCAVIAVINITASEERGDDISKLKDESQKQVEYLSRTNMKEKVGNKNYNNFIETLNATDDSRIKQLFNKLGDQLEFADISDGKSYSSGNKIHLNEKAFKGTSTAKPLQNVFHEIGHSFDSLGTKVLDSDFNHVSEIPSYKLKKAINDDLLKLFNSDLKIANGENYQKVKNLKKLSIFQQSDIVRKYKNLAEENPYKYSSLSDIMESTGGFIDGPLGSGHGLKYWKTSGKQETEFFAHMLEASANDDSREMMYELFPTASKRWEKMLDDILKN